MSGPKIPPHWRLHVVAVSALFALHTNFLFAAPIGQIPAKLDFAPGILAGVAKGDVDDPNGGTSGETYPVLSFVGAITLTPDRRVFTEVFLHSFTLDPGVGTVGQDVKQVGFAASYQGLMDWGTWRPWAGIGVGYSRNRFEDRLTTDQQGFVAQRFPNREENAFMLVTNLTKQWRVGTTWDVGLHIQYVHPLGSDVRALSVSGLLLF